MAESASHSVGGRRNIIVLGKTGCGKSTLANKIIGLNEEEAPFKVKQSIESVTTKIESVIEHVKIGKGVYVIHMIDTVGFCNAQSNGSKTDRSIAIDLKKHMRERAYEGINLIVFVFKRGRFSEEENRVFRIISQNFKDLVKECSCLVITNCDGLNEDAREKLILDFKTNELTKKFAEVMTKGIYTVGFPKVSDLSKRMKEAAIEDMKDDIAPIHDLITKSRKLYLNDDIQKDSFLENCTIL